MVSGVIAIIGAILGLLYGWNWLTQKDIITMFNPRTFYALIVMVASVVACICSLLLLIDKLAVLDALIVLFWGILLLCVFGGPFLALIAAILEIIGGLIGLITSIAT
nr:hypothetical protein [Candidatus Freyarchaeota archaeon]